MKMPLLGFEPRTAEWITTTTVLDLDVRLQQLGNLLGKIPMDSIICLRKCSTIHHHQFLFLGGVVCGKNKFSCIVWKRTMLFSVIIFGFILPLLSIQLA
jgi:hypothetical protein